MPLLTTVVGSMPKPDYLSLPSWVTNGVYHEDFVTKHNEALSNFTGDEYDSVIARATKENVNLQTETGLDVITDGEVRRDNYIFAFCRLLNGTDFVALENKIYRDGACQGLAPLINGKLSRNKSKGSMAKEWLLTSELSTKPVKMTLPGPMTIIDSMIDNYYGPNRERDLYEDLVLCIREEMEELYRAGCQHVQIDEPVLSRYPKKAAEIGLEMLNKCFGNVPANVCTTVHVCCGLPLYLDQEDYKKSNQKDYVDVITALDNCTMVKQISIEDTHRRNPPVLFQSLKKTTVVLGVIDVARSRIETVEEIKDHILDVLRYIPKERLAVAPDCGFSFLSQDILKKKLQNMVNAAKQIP